MKQGKKGGKIYGTGGRTTQALSRGRPGLKKGLLEVVIKSDTVGTGEAIEAAVESLNRGGPRVKIVHRGVGSISKSDVLLAATASRLLLGLGVDLAPKVAEAARNMGVEIHLFELIQDLLNALEVRSAPPPKGDVAPEAERIVGHGKIIALFKSSRRGIIIGCEITEGVFREGGRFRIISAMGPVYSGVIQSMQIDRKPVKEASRGRQVGIKIPDWKEAKIGDLVEVYETP